MNPNYLYRESIQHFSILLCISVQLEHRNELPVSTTEVLLELECSPKGKWEPPWHTLPQPTCPIWAAPKALLWDAVLAGRGRVCSALLSPSSFPLSSFVSTSAKHFWSGSSCSLGNRQPHKKATSGPFLFLLSLTGFFLFICHFTRAPVVLIAGLLRGLWADLPPGAFPVLMYLLWH